MFFTEADYRAYLSLFRLYSRRSGVEVLAFCLMPNHVHHVVAPPDSTSLSRAIAVTHARYAQMKNVQLGCTGHLWQERFYSSTLDDEYLWTAIRYVELNPVRAKIVDRASDYPWSSAAHHCGRRHETLLTRHPEWRRRLQLVDSWEEWLHTTPDTTAEDRLRACTNRDLPSGSGSFVAKLERDLGKRIAPAPRGRPRK